jgi:NAD(P)-dependent dehydrogenase (short-subunit alcohol dehydrogenase family)
MLGYQNNSKMKYLIIGGNSAIGKALIDLLVEDNHECIVLSRNPTDMDHPGVTFHQLNILEEDIPNDILPEALDGLVYLPGTITLKPFRMLGPDDFTNDFEINVLGAVKAIKSVVKQLNKSNHGSIVMFSTVAVQMGMPFHASIASAKGAVEGLTRSLAAEFAPKTRVNCVAPSLTDTPLASKLLSNDKKRESSVDRHPLKTIGNPADMAEAAYFLLSDKAKWVTGQVLGIDGGLSALRA